MWRRNDGFFLPELILSLSAWLLIAGIFFPLVMNIVNQSLQLKQEFEVSRLLYEELIRAKKEGVLPVSHSLLVNGTQYTISLDSSGGNTGVEVCIKYENVFKTEQKKCEIFE
ncbi:phosphatase [Bacillus sp. S/N-304-OC-R1]|uniref:phosphatase n=1 Tax=Bacillus sp. S/N-304-OC-R1 TaxID=2758034 RepID=UPI001C8D8495|nr:phosphatase [Bacillus sp. S/N-304-OC-R1]MBY0122407.1 phosphatase [Bacillus sp. S/N-304-OC-R1]